MIFAPVIGLLLCFIAERILCTPLTEPMSANISIYGCGPLETECLTGCCPHENGVCCSNLMNCCPAGKICVPIVGICVSAVNYNGDVALSSEVATPVRSHLPSLSWCPWRDWTDCGNWKCCQDNGVCCSDNVHCCPNGYKCDNDNKLCYKDTNNETDSSGIFTEPGKQVKSKSHYKSCPGGNRICPNYQSCCLNDEGEMDCCPDPSLPQIQYGKGECCYTFFGNICCPDHHPQCTMFGCVK